MEWETHFVSALKTSFAKAKTERGCSLRSFAKEIGIPVSTLSQVLKKKKKTSPKRAYKILQHLELSPTEKNLLLSLMNLPTEPDLVPMPNAQYEILTDWRQLATWMAFELEDVEKTAVALGSRLGLPPATVEEILTKLLERQMIQRLDDGKLVKIKDNWKTSDGPPRELLRRHHLENLKTAERALNHAPVGERDFTAYTFTGNLDQLELIRQEVRSMHQRIAAIVEGVGPKNRLLRFTVSFFPLDLPNIEAASE